MALDKTKVLNGPFTATLSKTGTPDTDYVTYTGLSYDKLSISAARKEDSQEIEDGSTDTWDGGADITIDLTVSEWDPTKLEALEDHAGDIDKCVFAFANKGRKLTLSNPDKVSVSIDGLKLKVQIKKSIGATEKISDHLVNAAIA